MEEGRDKHVIAQLAVQRVYEQAADAAPAPVLAYDDVLQIGAAHAIGHGPSEADESRSIPGADGRPGFKDSRQYALAPFRPPPFLVEEDPETIRRNGPGTMRLDLEMVRRWHHATIVTGRRRGTQAIENGSPFVAR